MIKEFYSIAISSVYIIHLLYALVIVIGFFLIIIGFFAGWRWIRNFTFRLIHLLMIGIVAVESVFNIECPLTWLEYKLMSLDHIKHGSMPFIAGMVDKVLYYNFPIWLFNAIYIVFGLTVFIVWFAIPPVYLKKQRI
ncbi:MAG: DUF2784 domain-containing protein [Deltaproteobacteria bacterium]|jgi:hypothetical protein|nr:DUF2784 domain-containing protein [Deltaproteobacteria bacterium]